MTIKTITTYICERCGEEIEKIAYTDWCIVTTQAKNGCSTHLCPSCSKRALEKPKPLPPWYEDLPRCSCGALIFQDVCPCGIPRVSKPDCK